MNIANGSLEMKDAIGPTSTGFGFGLTMTPALILQAIGCVVAIFGLFYTHRRYIESKRANDLAADRLKWEKDRYASSQITPTYEAGPDRESKD